MLMVSCGDVPSGIEFSNYVARNLALSSIVHGGPVSTRSAAYFTRRQVAKMLRRAPIQADFMIAGVDRITSPSFEDLNGLCAQTQPQLHWIDRTGTCIELPYGAQGPSAATVVAFLDQQWRADMKLDDALGLLRRCLRLLRGRFAFTPQGWQVCVVADDGARLTFSMNSDGEENSR